jgi:hypothetical protein
MKRQKSLPAATAFALSLCAISTAVWAQSTPTPTPVPPPTVPTPAPQEIPAPTPAPTPPPITPVTPAPIGSSNRPPPTRATLPPRPGDPTPPDQQNNDPNAQTGANPIGVGVAGAPFAGCNAFDCADINDNEELTEEEFSIFANDTIPFDDIDRDRNDRISPTEWIDYRRKQANGS